jgi:hypothetical protein
MHLSSAGVPKYRPSWAKVAPLDIRAYKRLEISGALLLFLGTLDSIANAGFKEQSYMLNDIPSGGILVTVYPHRIFPTETARPFWHECSDIRFGAPQKIVRDRDCCQDSFALWAARYYPSIWTFITLSAQRWPFFE